MLSRRIDVKGLDVAGSDAAFAQRGDNTLGALLRFDSSGNDVWHFSPLRCCSSLCAVLTQ
jgi:hypothetical protein